MILRERSLERIVVRRLVVEVDLKVDGKRSIYYVRFYPKLTKTLG
jgi:hypothetical protein